MTFVACPWLDGKHTVFGKAIDGLQVIKALEAVSSGNGATKKPVTIVDCGELWEGFLINFVLIVLNNNKNDKILLDILYIDKYFYYILYINI